MLNRSLLAVFAACSTLMLSASTALAAGDSERTPLNLEEESTKAGSGGGGGGLVRTIVGLAIVISVIYGVYWILKQVKASREESASGSGLSSVATLPLGPNRSLHLVRSGDELVLLGVGEQGVTPVRHYTEDDAREAGLLADHEEELPEPMPIAVVEASQPRALLPAPNGNGNGNGNGKPANVAEFLNRFVNDLRMRTVRR
jgi:flagellar protein FliO/FliZ